MFVFFNHVFVNDVVYYEISDENFYQRFLIVSDRVEKNEFAQVRLDFKWNLNNLLGIIHLVRTRSF